VVLLALIALVVLLGVFAAVMGGYRGLLRVACFALILAGAIGLTFGTLVVLFSSSGWNDSTTAVGLKVAIGGAALVVAGAVLDRATRRARDNGPPRGFEVNLTGPPNQQTDRST
jgi:hypothetical protein